MEVDRIAYFAASVNVDVLKISARHSQGYDLDHLKTIAFNLGIECRYYDVTKSMLVERVIKWYACNYAAICNWNNFRPY